MQKFFTLSILSVCLSPLVTQAAEFNMRAGTWEVTTSSDLLLFVPSIPADQMTRIKNLASEYGFELPNVENGAAISKTCITEEMAKQQTLPTLYQNQSGCTTQNATRSGNHYQLAFTCDNPELKGTGTATGDLLSAESFTGQTTFKGTVQGAPVNETAQIKGRWLTATCDATAINP